MCEYGTRSVIEQGKQIMKRTITTIIFIGFVTMLSGCGACSWRAPEQGTVEVKTVYGNITRIIRPSDGGVWENWWGDEYSPVDITNKTTDQVQVKASSKDNAALVLTVQLSYRIKDENESITKYVSRYGLNQKTREEKVLTALHGQINTEVKNAVAQYAAYELLANQQEIQKKIETAIEPILLNQFESEFISLQILGRPDFEDDRIEQAASAVVANQKLKEANQALLDASKIEQERKQLEATTFAANPTLLEIKKLELQKEIAAAWSAHQGTLVFGGNSQIQIPTAGK